MRRSTTRDTGSPTWGEFRGKIRAVAVVRLNGALGAIIAMWLAASSDAVIDVSVAVAVVFVSAALSTFTTVTDVVAHRRSDDVIAAHVGGDMLNMLMAVFVIDPSGSSGTWALLLVPVGEAVLLARRTQVAVGAISAAIIGIGVSVVATLGFGFPALERWGLIVFLAGGPMSVFFVQALRVQAALHRSNADRLRLAEMASHDDLTGLLNRRGLQQRCNAQDALRTVMMIDLDHFKAVNDTLGHEAGDEVLKTVGNRLSALLGTEGDVARLGGDEFGVVLSSDVDLGFLRSEIQRVVGEPVTVRGTNATVGASIGIAVATDDETLLGLLDRADADMYLHKFRRRDDPSPRDAAELADTGQRHGP